MELDPRKSRILTCVVESYIRTGEPIGSKMIAAMPEETVSSSMASAMTWPTSASRATSSSPIPPLDASPLTAVCATTSIT